MLSIGIILIILSLIICGINIYSLKNIHKTNIEIDKENKNIEQKNELLKQEKIYLEQENQFLKNSYSDISKQKEYLEKTMQEDLENKKIIIEKDFQEFKENLEKIKKETQEDWSYSKELCQKSYYELQQKEKQELDKVRSTRIAAQQALTREKEIKEKKNFYCLSCSPADKNDIQILERIKKDLNKPRILSMLIWSTYFQKQMNTLCSNVLGTDTVSGIYKITNQLTNECYIGQAVDIAKRFKDHAKCGLGIDTPSGNKLYKSMQEDGLWNFSFELLEKCPKDCLNEKEKYYINLYMSNNFGFNSTKGNK